MSLLNRHFWKFFFGLLAVMAVGFFVMYATHFWTKYQALQADVKAKEEFDRIQKLYQEDTFGGKTPEETLALFIDALKKGDTDLAAKYVLPEDRELISKNLNQAKVLGTLDQAVARLIALKRSKLDGDRAWFVITNENREIKYEVLLGKNSKGIWKIVSL